MAMDSKARRRPTWDDDSFAAEEGKARASYRVASQLSGVLDPKVSQNNPACRFHLAQSRA